MKLTVKSEAARGIGQFFIDLSDRLKSERHFSKVDMGETRLANNDGGGQHTCGTTACHGGWYLLRNAAMHTMKRQSVGYDNGADQMAIDAFGIDIKTFDSVEYPELHCIHNELELWARENPTIWGNRCGGAIFSGAHAFLSTPDLEEGKQSEVTLEKIGLHWIAVADCLNGITQQAVEIN